MKTHQEVSPEKAFYAKNGHVYKNLHHLHSGLKDMDDDTWQHHVNEEKNDFSEWLKHVLDEEHLASKLSSSRSKAEALSHIEDHLNPKSKNPQIPSAQDSTVQIQDAQSPTAEIRSITLKKTSIHKNLSHDRVQQKKVQSHQKKSDLQQKDIKLKQKKIGLQQKKHQHKKRLQQSKVQQIKLHKDKTPIKSQQKTPHLKTVTKIMPKKIPDLKQPDPEQPMKNPKSGKSDLRKLMLHPLIKDHTDYGIRMFAYGIIIGFIAAFFLSFI